MLDSIRDRHGTALGDPQERKPIYTSGVDHCFKITDPGVKRERLDVPVGHAIAPRVIADQGMLARQTTNEVLPDWTFPVIFKVVHPICGLNQRRSTARPGVGETNTVRRATILNLLFEVRRAVVGTVARLPVVAGLGLRTNQTIAATWDCNHVRLLI